MTRRPLFPNILVVGLIVVTAHCKPATNKASDVTSSTQDTSQPADSSQPAPTALGGTSWRLVKFQSSDGTILKPDDKSKYTIAFEPDGRLSARIDCNRGRGTWKSSGPPQLEFGPLALTRMMCPPGSLHDRIVKQLPYVRSYVLKDGHLFLSLMADGGIFEFEPTANEQRR
jgi:heat shock protein HslJ